MPNFLGTQNPYVREITEILVEVQAVANNELIRNFESQVVDWDIKIFPGWFGKEGADPD